MAKPSDAPRTSRYLREREELLAAGDPCWMCGGPATEADHQPPVKLHAHVDGTGCCELWPACRRCQAEQGFKLGWGRQGPVPPTPALVESSEVENSPGPEHPCWNVPWLGRSSGCPG